MVEIVGGVLTYTFSMGSDSSSVTLSMAAPVNDGAWHTVRCGRPSRRFSTMTVDGVTVEATPDGGTLSAVDLNLPMYVGGHPNAAAAAGLTATRNLVGCLSDLYFEMDYDLPEQHCGDGAKTYNGQSFDSYVVNMDGNDYNQINPLSADFSMSFSFKTTADNALIFFAGQDVSDHILIEVVAGLLHFRMSTGGLACQLDVHSTAR